MHLTNWQNVKIRPNYYSLQYNHFGAFFGINAADVGIYPKKGPGINLDLHLCTVPTVGLYKS